MSISPVTPFHLGAERLPPPLAGHDLDGTVRSFVRASVCGLSEEIIDSPAMHHFERGYRTLMKESYPLKPHHQALYYFPSYLIRQLAINTPLSNAYSQLLREEKNFPSNGYFGLDFLVAYPYLAVPLRTRLLSILSTVDDSYLSLSMIHDISVTSQVMHNTNSILAVLHLKHMPPSFLVNYFAKAFHATKATTPEQLIYLSTLSHDALSAIKSCRKLTSPSYLVSPHGTLASPYKTIARSTNAVDCLRRTTRSFPFLTPIDLRPSAHPWASSRDLISLWEAFSSLSPGRCLSLDKPCLDDLRLAVTDASIRGRTVSTAQALESWIREPSVNDMFPL